MKMIPASVVEDAMTYAEYRAKIEDLRAEGKTTGPNHSEAMIKYTDLNRTRMNRLDKTTRLTTATQEVLSNIKKPLQLLVLTEAWCGDAAQSIPVLNKIAEASDALSLKLILRDENLEIMDAFLTNGGRSIPKVIFLDAEDQTVLGTWGPRPEEVQKMVLANKILIQNEEDPEEKKKIQHNSIVETQKWYAKDKTVSIQAEIMQTLASFEQALVH
ncbi:MAG: thioredoxin family protein [Mameliella sp.]|nr:thioredoxin family protein [Phaeodactylibacter sp.]